MSNPLSGRALSPCLGLLAALCGCTASSPGGHRSTDSPALAVVDTEALATRLASFDSAVEARRLATNVPGAAVAIVYGDRVLSLRGFGQRDIANRLPVTPHTLFLIGSCTKPFTALAAAISADQGRLSLDDSPRRFLPYFHLLDPAADTQVTMRDLLSHRTGVPDDLGGGWYERYQTRERLIQAAMSRPATGTFRQTFHYNNYMFLAAGEAIAVANHMSYEDVIRDVLFEPLGMRLSSLSLDQMEASPDFAYGYEDSARTVISPTRLIYNTAIAPAANINSNAEDMAQWLRLLVGGGIVGGHRLVSEASFRALLAPAVRTGGGAYALGWFTETWHGLQLYSHPGGVAGYGARCEFLPQQHLGWVVLTNVDDQVLPKAVRELIHAYLLAAPPR